MSLTMRRLIICALGLFGGIAAWPASEWILNGQSGYSSYLVFGIVQGVVLGAFFGAFLGSAEGLTAGLPVRAAKGFATGLVIGAVGGIVGTLIGQGSIFLAGGVFSLSYGELAAFGYPAARAVGWGFMGIFVGMAEGIRAGSSRKIGMGVLGGFIGGLIGGAALEYLRSLFPDNAVVRLAGLAILGLSVAGIFALIESRLSHGYLMILNGDLKGKEFPMNQRKLRLGSSQKADVVLKGYKGVDALHAVVQVRRGELELDRQDGAGAVTVNDEKVENRSLKYEDVIRIGDAAVFYRA